ncbi:hypothetical protein [Cerasicoccus maritimus]|uniref:hypothetical protein n=1 Tax=Cerasicoccus maritimus TaxID=490089 RepID=UPI002852AA73|nr:hypothetical protein [Cerasicoccus maritimus]
MFIKKLGLSISATIFVLQALFAEHLVIDDFDSYSNTEELRLKWNSFGSAASSGPASLAIEEGYAGSNAALFNLNWDVGNNANMRLFQPPTQAQNLTRFITCVVWLKILRDDGNFDAPSTTTSLRLAIEGGPDNSIWQTKADEEVEIDFGKYEEAQFSLLDTEMERVSGKSSFNETLAEIKSIRLRFENQIESRARQDVYIDSVIVITNTK